MGEVPLGWVGGGGGVVPCTWNFCRAQLKPGLKHQIRQRPSLTHQIYARKIYHCIVNSYAVIQLAGSLSIIL